MLQPAQSSPARIPRPAVHPAAAFAVAPVAPVRSTQPAIGPAVVTARPPSPAPSGPARSGPGRRTPPRLRAFFLRHFRACGEVKQAAERTGVAVSTLYRWRDRDASFRKRWDSLTEQRRQMVEDRLMSFALEGEKTAVFHKGEQVGWRVSHTARAAIAALAYFDRREKAALAAAAREDARDEQAGQEEDDDDSRMAPQKRKQEVALASRSGVAAEPENVAGSIGWSAEGPRKIGSGSTGTSARRISQMHHGVSAQG